MFVISSNVSVPSFAMNDFLKTPSSRFSCTTCRCFVFLLLSVFVARSSALEPGHCSTCDDELSNLQIFDVSDEGAPNMLQTRAWLQQLMHASGSKAAESAHDRQGDKRRREDISDTMADTRTHLKSPHRTSELQASLSQESKCMCSDHAVMLDLHMSKQQLLAELQVARKRVMTLEALLATSETSANAVNATNQAKAKQSSETLLATTNDVLPEWSQDAAKQLESFSNAQPSTQSLRFAKLSSLFVISVALIAFIVRTIIVYEKERDEFEPPWFHHNPLLTRVLSGIACLWLTFGIFCFTELMGFTDTGRYLTTTEAIYLNSQLITTVGYGDLTPTSSHGSVFMMFYSVIAVFLFGTLTQHMIMWYVEMSGESVGETSWAGMFMPIAVCCLIGTCFFSLYPGEEKPLWECLNMSVITFITVGFGNYVPVTQGGQFFASLWMVAGVLCTGKAIVDMTNDLFLHRQNLRSQAAALKAFDEIDKAHKGFIDKVQFLSFELIQEGFEQSRIDEILGKFDEFDLEHDGRLNFTEFKAYVDSLSL